MPDLPEEQSLPQLTVDSANLVAALWNHPSAPAVHQAWNALRITLLREGVDARPGPDGKPKDLRHVILVRDVVDTQPLASVYSSIYAAHVHAGMDPARAREKAIAGSLHFARSLDLPVYEEAEKPADA